MAIKVSTAILLVNRSAAPSITTRNFLADDLKASRRSYEYRTDGTCQLIRTYSGPEAARFVRSNRLALAFELMKKLKHFDRAEYDRRRLRIRQLTFDKEVCDDPRFFSE